MNRHGTIILLIDMNPVPVAIVNNVTIFIIIIVITTMILSILVLIRRPSGEEGASAFRLCPLMI